MRKTRICPRCGLLYSYIEKKRVGNREYYYAVHESYDKEKKKKIRRRCYLGPREYIYVSSLHEFVLRGLIDPERIIKYLIEITNYVRKIYPQLSPEIKKEVFFLLEKLLHDLRSLD